jgi:hypothetical protein
MWFWRYNLHTRNNDNKGGHVQLKLRRSQRASGVMGSTVVFLLDARAELTDAEEADVKKYKLGSQVIYNSEASKRQLDKADANAESGGFIGVIKSLINMLFHRMALNITIDSLVKGHHIEAKDMGEMLRAEGTLRSACENMKTYLETAATFDGREQVIEF